MKKRLIHQWVKDATKLIGGQAELARRLSAVMHRDIDRAAVNKMVSGKRDVTADEFLAIETVSGLAIPSPNVAHKIPLIDWVSASRFAEPTSQLPIEESHKLAFADLGPGQFFALMVAGNSMDRVSPEGSVIVVNRTDRDLIAGRFYVFSLRGETTFKRWQSGPPGYLEPYSTDPSHRPIFIHKKRDLEVVGRVKRTLLDL